MALAILIDDFVGHPKELYDQIVTEIEKREILGVKFTSRSEHRSKGWFTGESAATLGIEDEDHLALVLAYQFGRSFHVSTRAYWKKAKLSQKEQEGKLPFLEEVRSGAFSETVDRAVQAALALHLQQRQTPVPPSLNPRDIFYRRQTQTSEAEG